MIPGSANPLLLKSAAAAAGGYQVSRSLRFNSSDSGFLSRTPAVAGDRTKWTWAGWVKRSALTDSALFICFVGGGDYSALLFNADRLQLINVDNTYGGIIGNLLSSSVYRDVSAWYHIVASVDEANATAADRLKLLVNGVRITDFTINTPSSGNRNWRFNSTASHNISSSNGGYFNGYLADIHFIDGQALTPSSFTEVSATTGQLLPKAYSGSYGTNGFYLQFADNSSNTAATLGKDTSGNSNNWTPNNLSVTAGAGNDSLVDTPTSISATDTGVGGEVRGNYATLNPLNSYSAGLSNGNLQLAQTTTSWIQGNSTIGVSSGKWYWEVTWTSGANILNGITKSPLATSFVGSTSDSWGWSAGGTYYNGGASAPYGSSLVVGDVTGVALNMDAGTLTFYRNGVSQGVLVSGLSGTFFAAISVYDTTTENINFGQRAFAYTAPSGFKALCDTNLGAPVVAKPNTVMDVALYTGNGGTQTISSLAFEPDFVWVKERSTGATSHHLVDQVRGADKYLFSQTTDAEYTGLGRLTAFTSTGFTVAGALSTSSQTYVGWAWDAGTSTVSNTAGSITSQVRANVSAGFSVVTYTGNGTSGATIGHSLGVAPSLILVKCRSNAAGWLVYHSSIGATKYLALESTAAAGTYSGAWNDTAPTSTVFSVGNDGSVNTSTRTYVAYCFAPVVGYSSMGSYVGNGSADGPFVYTGFRPRWVLFKNTNSGENWRIMDAARNTYNVANSILYPNLSNSEGSSAVGFDILSNGFKIRETGSELNASGVTIIYAAFAENPFQYARAR